MDYYKPTIPPKVRDAVYIGGLIVGGLTGLAVTLVAVWLPEYSEQANGTGVAVTTFVALIVGGLGTAYRPGAQTP